MTRLAASARKGFSRRYLWSLSAMSGLALVWAAGLGQQPQPAPKGKDAPRPDVLTSRPLPKAPAVKAIQVGDVIATQAGQRRLVALPGGVLLYVNEKTEVKLETAQQLVLTAGEIFVETAPGL